MAVGRIYTVRFAFCKGRCSCSVETGQEGTGAAGGSHREAVQPRQGRMERNRHMQQTCTD